MTDLIFQVEAPPLETGEDGVVRVGGTRVTLETIISVFKHGATAEEIAQKYPTVSLADIYATIAYYLNHRLEIERYLEQQERTSEEVRRQNEARFNSVGIRERLMAGLEKKAK